jgi:hypothetical protein
MSASKEKIAGTAVLLALIVACSPSAPASATAQQAAPAKAPVTTQMHGMEMPANDSAFADMQKRGQMAMGVNQYMSQHKFDITPDGGRIELQRESPDSLDVAQIRAHMKLIQHAFAAGDFSTPAFVHMKNMPGTDVMAKKKDLITYTYGDLPLGAEVRISTRDAAAKAAITQFLSAQRMEHRAVGENMKM